MMYCNISGKPVVFIDGVLYMYINDVHDESHEFLLPYGEQGRSTLIIGVGYVKNHMSDISSCGAQTRPLISLRQS